MRDYWVILDKHGIVLGSAEVKAGSLTKEQVLTPHDNAVNAFNVSEEIFNEQEIGKPFISD